MNSIIKSHFENARESLRANRFRTFLAIVGVMVGVAGITLSLSLATSATRAANNSTQAIPDTVALLRSGAAPDGSFLAGAPRTAAATTLHTDDAAAIIRQQNIAAAPMAFIHARLVTTNRTLEPQQTTVIGTTGHLKDIAGITMAEGQFIDEANGAVISHQLSIDLFGTERSLGSVITIHGEPVTVVGIMKPTHQPLDYLNITPGSTLFLPINLSKRLTHNTSQVQQIALRAESATALNDRLPDITAAITKRHHDTTDFHVITSKDLAAQRAGSVNMISIIAAVIASISLIIGGVGIMNSMLVTVAERQREIGIRKAVGATNGHIISQFLIEATIIGLLGGIIGYGIGIAATYALSFYLPFTPVAQWYIALTAIIIAVLTGVIFGLYPATRAAIKDPIEALRY
ncbi:MAG: ABC transporter permease [Candidatus Saccharibacteria bacterium]|nr:ABC transporter permease [Candidatus Saccharibacteria bacterium]